MPAGWAAAATAGSAVLGAGSSLIGGGKASSAAKDAANTQKQMYLQTRADLSPYTQAGTQVLPALNALATSGPTGGGPNYVDLAYKNYLPPQMTQAELEKTPGYQFNLSQGLKAVQSANAAKGLGVSGAALKGAAQFATGLADSTYQQQFANAQTRFSDVANLSGMQQQQLQNQYARLHDTAALGENAGAATGTAGTASAQNQGNALIQAGQYQGAAGVNATNALTQGVQSYLGYNMFQDALKSRAGTSNYGGGDPAGTSKLA